MANAKDFKDIHGLADEYDKALNTFRKENWDIPNSAIYFNKLP